MRKTFGRLSRTLLQLVESLERFPDHPADGQQLGALLHNPPPRLGPSGLGVQASHISALC